MEISSTFMCIALIIVRHFASGKKTCMIFAVRNIGVTILVAILDNLHRYQMDIRNDVLEGE